MSQRDLVALAQGGDLRAFDELIALNQGRVFALAHRILGNAEDAADIQQETFVRAWRCLGGFRRDAEFPTWLHRITLNLCLSRKRRKGIASEMPLIEENLAHGGTAPAACLERTETSIMLRQALAAMPAHYRALLVLREIEGRSFEEIAEVMGCSAAGARTRASKARKMLRERMQPYLAEE